MSKLELVDIACNVLHETDKAILIDDGTQKVWLPISQVEVGPAPDGRTAIVTMPQWLAEEKELV